MKDYKVSDVYLTFGEKLSLKNLKKQKPIKNSKHFDRLMYYGLIQLNYVQFTPGNMPVNNGTYSITKFGKNYLIYLSTFNRTKFFEWLRYIITTIIAVIALMRTLQRP